MLRYFRSLRMPLDPAPTTQTGRLFRGRARTFLSVFSLWQRVTVQRGAASKKSFLHFQKDKAGRIGRLIHNSLGLNTTSYLRVTIHLMRFSNNPESAMALSLKNQGFFDSNCNNKRNPGNGTVVDP